MKSMSTLTFPNGETYEIVDKALREQVSKKMHFVPLHTEYINYVWHIYNEENELMSFDDVRSLYLADEAFVYLIHANVVHIPAFLETGAIEFTGSYILSNVAHFSRVIINTSDIVHLGDFPAECTDNKVDDFDGYEPDSATGAFYAGADAVVNLVNSQVSKLQEEIDVLTDVHIDMDAVSLVNRDGKICAQFAVEM